jgi:hypothetical protein
MLSSLIVLCSLCLVNAQESVRSGENEENVSDYPETTWGKQIGKDNYQSGSSVVVDPQSGDVFVAGKSAGSLFAPNAGQDDYVIMRLDGFDGTLKWGVQYGNYSIDVVGAITLDANGDLLVAGTVYGATAGDSDCFIVKLAPEDGSIILMIQCGGGDIDTCNDIVVNADGNYLVAGATSGNWFGGSSGSIDAIAMKLRSEDLEIMWGVQFNSTTDYYYGQSIVSTPDNNIALLVDALNCLVYKLNDTAGQQLWETEVLMDRAI